MSNKPTDELFDHTFDGIQEYDNPIPSWVNWILLGTVIYSVFHVIYVQFGPGQTVAEEYAAAVRAHEAAKPVVTEAEMKRNEATLSQMMANAEDVAAGRKSFETYCVACHAEQGEGQIGPNLTDDYWIHGDGTLMAIRSVVKKGVLEKGMPSWEMQLSPEQLDEVAAYIGTLRGTDVEGKAPEGELRKPPEGSVEAPPEGETASL
jgi:cytochrome c oxidase cbb3-type subunit 3